MKRIMVVGVSSGVGKSTFAKSLGKALNIHVYHLDALYWKPGWVESSLEDFSKAQREMVMQPQWIIEGNYTNTFDIRADHADTIIYLELPLYVCLYRVVKRWFMHMGRTRPDMGEGCKEKIDWKFIQFIFTTYYPRKRKMNERFHSFQSAGSTKEIIVLPSKRQIQFFLENLIKS
ncbi:P-loop NTPase family protein [Neobacillus dielmonensis]|uniref:topology modulation protein n=1 Tax=Neobacillus dielmonensis TaxID=1347369 RepID=UPI0005A85CF8|nr:topology modulation protein [Neobacillus dielmonensis]